MIRVAIYARFSSELQKDKSLDDQIRICREYADREGWKIVGTYKDRAQTGANLLRPGLQSMIQDARYGEFDLILSEALDRLSRDQADIAVLFRDLSYQDVKIHTLSEGQIDLLQVGMKGTMNAIFLKDLKDKIRRGMSGLIEDGLSAGGLPYGYEVDRKFDEKGEPIRGYRKIIPEQANVINRIYKDYAAGISPRAIALNLNQEKIPGPTNKGWSQSTINGNRKRGLGILRNEIYSGMLVWNKQRFVKDPQTGKRISRYNPEKEWIRHEVPELQIVEPQLWSKVQARLKSLPSEQKDFRKAKRPTYLTSGIIKCGCCEGSFVMSNHSRLACSTLKNKGTCNNDLKILREDVEKAILHALQFYLMDEELCDAFTKTYVKHLNDIRKERNTKINEYKSELEKIESSDELIMNAIMDGFRTDKMREQFNANDKRRKQLVQLLENSEEDPIILHPGIAGRYKEEIHNLIHLFHNENHRSEAIEIIRSLIDKIVLTPNDQKDALKIDLYGDLAGILSVASKRDKSLILNELSLNEIQLVAEDSCQLNSMKTKLVAGEGLEPPTRGL